MALDINWESYFTPNTTFFTDGEAWYQPWHLAYMNRLNAHWTVPQIYQYIIGKQWSDLHENVVVYAEVSKTLRFGSTAQLIMDVCSDRDIFEIVDNTTSGIMLPRMQFPYRMHRINLQAKGDAVMPTNMFVGHLVEASIQSMSDIKNDNQDGRWRVELNFVSPDHPRGLLGRNKGAPLWHHRANNTTDNYHLAFRSSDALSYDSAITQIVAWMNTSRPTTDFPLTFSYTPKGTDPYKRKIGSNPIAIQGNVTFTNGNATVTGDGTSHFDTDLQINQLIRHTVDGYTAGVDNGNWATILSIESPTSLTLTAPYSFTGGGGNAEKLPISDVVTVDGNSTWSVLEKLLIQMGAVEALGLKYIPTLSATGVIDITQGGYDKTAAVDEDFRTTMNINKNTSTVLGSSFNLINVLYTAYNDDDYWIQFNLYKQNGTGGWDTVYTYPAVGSLGTPWHEYIKYDPNNRHGNKFFTFPTQPAGTYKWDVDLVTGGSFAVTTVGGSAFTPQTYQFLNSPLRIDYSKVNSFLVTRGLCYEYGQYSTSVGNGLSPEGCKDGVANCTDSGRWGGCYPDIKAPTTALTGTVTMTNGSTTVTGSSTLFTTELYPGDQMKLNADSSWGIIGKIISNTSITLSSVYGGTGGSGAASRREGVNSTFGIQGAYANVKTLSNKASWDTVCRLNSKKLYQCQLNTDSLIRAPISGTVIFNDGYTADLVGKYIEVYSPELDDMVILRVTEQKHIMAQGRMPTVLKGYRV